MILHLHLHLHLHRAGNPTYQKAFGVPSIDEIIISTSPKTDTATAGIHLKSWCRSWRTIGMTWW